LALARSLSRRRSSRFAIAIPFSVALALSEPIQSVHDFMSFFALLAIGGALSEGFGD
jgi:hypothetical protein